MRQVLGGAAERGLLILVYCKYMCTSSQTSDVETIRLQKSFMNRIGTLRARLRFSLACLSASISRKQIHLKNIILVFYLQG